jgi:hypothetical protein
MIDSVATAVGCSHGLAYSIMYDWSFRKGAHGGCPENWRTEKKLNEWVSPCHISYAMQMKEKIYLTGLLPGKNHGCITIPTQIEVIQCNGNIPVLLQPESLKLCHQLRRLCLLWFGIFREYC